MSTTHPAPRGPLSLLRSRHRLHRQIMAVLGAAFLVTLLTTVALVAVIVNQSEAATWRSRQTEAAYNAARTVSEFLQRSQDALVLMSLLGRDELATQPQVMHEVLDYNPALLEVIGLDAGGKVFASAYRDRAVLANLFTIPQSQWFVSAQAGRLYLGGVRLSAGDTPYLIIALPGFEGGVIAARLSMDVMWRVVGDIHFGEAGRAYVIDQTGAIIAHTDPAVVLSNTTLADRPDLYGILQAAAESWSGAYRSLNGLDVVGVTAPVAGTAWLVVTELPLVEAYAYSLRTVTLLAIMLLASSVAVMAALRLIFNRLVFAPVTRLQTGAERIGQGQLEHRIGLVRQDEIGQVARAFDEMAQRVQERDQTLTAQAAALTAEIAERRRANEALRASEKQLRRITDNMRDVISEIDAQGNILYASPSHLWVLGCKPEDVLGLPIYDRLHPDDASAALLALAEALNSSTTPNAVTFRYRHTAGHYLWMECNATLLHDGAGEPTGAILSSRDVTQRRSIENSLRDSEARYRAIVEDQTELICRWLPDGTLTFVNEAYCRYFDRARDQLIGYSFIPLIPEEDRVPIELGAGNFSPDRPVATYEHRVILPNGSLRWQAWTDRAIYDAQGQLIEFASVGRDITDRKQAETALRQHDAYLAALHETSLGLINRLDLTDLLTSVVTRATRLVNTAHGYLYLVNSEGTHLEVRMGTGVFAGNVGYQLKPGEGLAGQVWQTGQPMRVDDYARWPQRSARFARTNFHAIAGVPLKSGTEVIGVIGVGHVDSGICFGDTDVEILLRLADLASIALDNANLYHTLQQDITARKQAEDEIRHLNANLEQRVLERTAQLREAEAKYRLLVEQIPAVTYISGIDAAGSTVYVSPQIEAMVGYEPAVWQADPVLWSTALHPDDRDRVLATAGQCAARGEPLNHEYRLIARDGHTIWVRDEARLVLDQANQPLHWQGVMYDVTDRKRAEIRSAAFASLAQRLTATSQSKEAAHIIVDVAHDLLGWDVCFLDLYSSETGLMLYNVLMLDTVGGQQVESSYPDTNYVPTPTFRRAIDEGGQLVLLHDWDTEHGDLVSFGEGEQQTISLMFVPIRHGARVIGVLSIQSYAADAYDQSALDTLQALADHCGAALERIAAEQALRESEERYRRVSELSSDYAYSIRVEPDGTRVPEWATDAFTRVTGYTLAEMADNWDKMMYPADVDVVLRPITEQRFDALETSEFRIVTRTGEVRWLHNFVNLVWDEARQRVVRVYGAAQDITARKVAEDQIRASLREKEVLLKEIHHRVKNNLQVISSLLSLQSNQVTDTTTLELLRESQNRVRSMALIHEKLYQSSDLASVDFAEYVRSLATYLFRSYKASPAAIALSIDAAPDIQLSLDAAIPCGLIVNELVSNALKHAFPDGRAGEIRVAFGRSDDGQFSLRVGDNGVGFPAGLDFRRSTSLGLQLVSTLIEQLDGTIELQRNGGTEFVARFSDLKR